MLMTIVAFAISVIFVVCLWRILNWVWLKPKKLERLLRRQGLDGNPYRLLHGDSKEASMMSMEALSKPISLHHDITPRVNPFLYHTLKKYGKNSFMWHGPTPRVNVMNPEHIKFIFNKIDEFQKSELAPLLKLVLISGLSYHEGEKWAKHRKIVNPAFHQEKLKNMIPAFHESCKDMMNKWEELVFDKEWIELDVWPHLTSLTRDVISRTAFSNNYKEGKRIFQLLDELAILSQRLIETVYIPGWRFLPTKINKRMMEIDNEIRVSLKEMINKREKAMKEGKVVNDDLLNILLESNSKEIEKHGGNKNSGMSITDVIDECKTFHFAGQETTSVMLVWTMILLAKHTIWQSRARDEVFKVFGNKKLDFDGLNHLRVLTMILHEVLRLYPPVTWLLRSIKKEMKVGNFVLPAGVEVSMPIMLIHHDCELWGDDAIEFKPERFAEGVSKATNNQISFFPFGQGPRICIGQNFSLIEGKMTLAMILQRFTFELSPSYAHSPFQALTLHAQHGAPIILRRL